MNLIEHKKARMNYEILEEFEAGIELLGFEVKSIRAHHGSLEGAHVVVRPSGRKGRNEAYIVGMDIPPFQAANAPTDYDRTRSRRLLLKAKELADLAKAEQTKGLTVVPIALYSKVSKVKMRIAIARGRKQYDKRAILKKRDVERDMRRTLKGE